MKRPIYLGSFSCKADVEQEFSITFPLNACILVAAYKQEDYEGEAFVLFRCRRKLFEVHGSHCSCNGLSGEWNPEACTRRELQARLNAGGHFCQYYFEVDDAVIKALNLKPRKV